MACYGYRSIWSVCYSAAAATEPVTLLCAPTTTTTIVSQNAGREANNRRGKNRSKRREMKRHTADKKTKRTGRLAFFQSNGVCQLGPASDVKLRHPRAFVLSPPPPVLPVLFLDRHRPLQNDFDCRKTSSALLSLLVFVDEMIFR